MKKCSSCWILSSSFITSIMKPQSIQVGVYSIYSHWCVLIYILLITILAQRYIFTLRLWNHQLHFCGMLFSLIVEQLLSESGSVGSSWLSRRGVMGTKSGYFCFDLHPICPHYPLFPLPILSRPPFPAPTDPRCGCEAGFLHTSVSSMHCWNVQCTVQTSHLFI